MTTPNKNSGERENSPESDKPRHILAQIFNSMRVHLDTYQQNRNQGLFDADNRDAEAYFLTIEDLL